MAREVPKMNVTEIKPHVYWVGCIDWDLRYFHGPTYHTHRGTTYNSYLIIDDKITLVDGVYGPFAAEWLAKIRQVVDPASIDYLIVNHIEPDHSGAIPDIMRVAPNAKIFCTQKAAEGLKKYYPNNWDIQVVKTGDELDLGQRTIKFLEAAMLHWPDTMFSYVPEDKLLLPNDAFGQHYASTERFDDEVDEFVLMQEAAKYYANILMPFSKLFLRKLEEIQSLGWEIDMIAPSHGIIWRANPQKIVDAHLRWTKGDAGSRALVLYDTMWGSTEKMARAIIEGLKSKDVDARLYKMSVSDRTEIIAEILEAKAIVLGSSTFNNDYLPSLSPILDEIQGLKPTNRIGLAFGSYGWRTYSVPRLEEVLKKSGIEIAAPGYAVQWAPSPEELATCRQIGEKLGEQIKASI